MHRRTTWTILAKYVRDEGFLTLEEAIHKMTAIPARWMAQTDRGALREGMLADIVVFDPAEIRDLAQYTDPHHYSEGVRHLLINGVPVILQGDLTDALPGQFLSRGRTPPQ